MVEKRSSKKDFEEEVDIAFIAATQHLELYAFQNMKSRYGTFRAACLLLNENRVHSALWLLARANLLRFSVEEIALKTQYRHLFNETQLSNARAHLNAVGQIRRAGRDKP